MADDITLTVRVRDMTRGDFDRLGGRLDRMRRDLRGVSRDTESAGMHSRRLGQDLEGLGQKFQKMQQTGRLTRRELTQMRGTLDAMSRSALKAAQSGEITQEKYHSLSGEIGHMRTELNRFDAGLNNNTNTLRNNGNQVRTVTRLHNGLLRSITTTTRSVHGNNSVLSTFSNNMNQAGNSIASTGGSSSIAGRAFSNMRAKLIGVAVVLGASLLPTIGALAPMLAGIGSIVGVAALAFGGLSKPTKQLSADQKAFKKGLKPLISDFHELQKAAQKAVLPGLTKSFGDISKTIKSLNPVVKVAGKAFSTLVDKIAKGVSSKDFMGPFLENVKIGTAWVLEFAGSFGKFMKAFFEFGTKSKPALAAWQDLLGGFLDRGLPKMFKNMESGIKGSSKFLLGLSSLINDGLLPGLGTLVGKFMEAFGPTIGQLLRSFGRAFTEVSTDVGDLFITLKPVGKVVGNIVDGLMDLGRISLGSMLTTVKEIGGALFKTFVEVFADGDSGGMKDSIQSLSTWIQDNESSIRSAFTNIGQSFIDMVGGIAAAVPELLSGFSFLTDAVLTFLDATISGAATAFGWVPGIGGQLEDANTKFDEFAKGVRDGLDTAVTASEDFRDKLGPNLARAKLSMNVDEATRNLNDIKTQLEDPALTKERKAKLTADKTEADAKLRAAKADLAEFDKRQAKAKLDADANSFWGKISAAVKAQIPKKTASVGANTDGFWGDISGIVGRVLGTSYINVQKRIVESSASPTFTKANGGVMKYFANGGTENHTAQIAPAGSWRVWGEPETGGESYIPLAQSKRSRSRKVAEDTVGILGGDVQWFAKGGMSDAQKKAQKDARSGLASSMNISRFGRMAGYTTNPMEKSLGKPADLGALASALNGLRGDIKAAFSGKQESSLLKQLDKAGKALIKQQKSLTAVSKALDTAKTKLDDLKSAATSFKESITSGVMSATDITRNTADDKNLTVADLMATMTEGRDQSSAFAKALDALKKKGVSKDIIQQIAEAGISGGGLETAGTLLTASASEIKSMNKLQSQINASAKSAGKTASDALYAAGIKAAEGLVKGLEKKQKAIENAMMKIAKGMEKAIKKALGIKSPSKVMQQVGDYTAEGFAIGMEKNSRVGNAWESMLTTKPTAGSASSGSGSGAPQIIQVYVGSKMIDEIVLDSNRRTVRTRGGNVQAVYGR